MHKFYISRVSCSDGSIDYLSGHNNKVALFTDDVTLAFMFDLKEQADFVISGLRTDYPDYAFSVQFRIDDFSQFMNPPLEPKEDGSPKFMTREEHKESHFPGYNYSPVHSENIEASPTFDPVSNPSHYTDGKYECIDVMVEQIGKEAVIDFCKCNAFKYLWRAGKKENNSELQDIKKACWYLTKSIELMEE